jgi:hypothetical protein
MMSRAPVILAVAAASATLVITSGAPARAQERSIIRDPGDHPSYIFEAEPHGILGFGYPYDNVGLAPGIGFRGTFHIADGPVKSINDSFGVGFGFDFAPEGDGRLIVPIVFQWNFWLSTHWSVFGEPGFAITNGPTQNFIPAFFAGGRYHFTDRIALTMRIGYPDISVGVSFLL